MGSSRRTRDIGTFRASNTNQEPSQAPNRPSSGVVAECLKSMPELCMGPVRFIEEHTPAEIDSIMLTIRSWREKYDLKLFEDLLGPINDEIMTKMKYWTHTSPILMTRNTHGDHLDAQNASKSTLKLFFPSSSGHSIFPDKGLIMNAREVCKMWASCATNHFQLASFQWFKDTRVARHEYLLFKLQRGESTSPTHKVMWLRLERRPSAKAESSKRKLMGSLWGQFIADDLITISPRREDLLHLDGSSLEQASATFHEKLSLRYLLEVLNIIHGESPEYHLAGAHCWFYASTIAEIVTKKVRVVWEHGSISHCDHWMSKNIVNPEQYTRIMDRVRHLREYQN
ncbi:hypothetical protein RHS01_07884 [Rhizoctonia solani]|uniref:Uncharacterized protein n=1 Tax=Rhizoctonia solani TaxID=456999 RepID=A0A8H7I8P2_9AGAM|nr:hypothetical protein RHS01_07884 [Rhizoctonia solani]